MFLSKNTEVRRNGMLFVLGRYPKFIDVKKV